MYNCGFQRRTKREETEKMLKEIMAAECLNLMRTQRSKKLDEPPSVTNMGNDTKIWHKQIA